MITSSPTFTCIGNACTDIVASVPESFLEKYGIRKSFCTHLESTEELNRIKSSFDHHNLIAGGAGGNTAHALSALGANANFIGSIGDDPEGHSFLENMTNAGVISYIHLSTDKGACSTQVLCLITPDGDRTFASYIGVAETFGGDQIPESVIKKTDLLYLDGYTFSSNKAAATYLDRIDLLHKTGGLACLNVGDRSLIETKRDDVTSVLEKCDAFICNKAEGASLYGENETAEDLARTMSEKFRFGAVTDGGAGAWIFKDGNIVHSPALDISHIDQIDSIGAGDHFSAGFLYAIMNGFPLEQAGKLASLCAVDCLSHAGGRPLGGKDSLKHLVEQIKT